MQTETSERTNHTPLSYAVVGVVAGSLAALALLTLLEVSSRGLNGVILYIVVYAAFYYATALLLVFPLLWLRPMARRAGIEAAMTWGAVSAGVAALPLFGLQAMFIAITGAIGGAFYVWTVGGLERH